MAYDPTSPIVQASERPPQLSYADLVAQRDRLLAALKHLRANRAASEGDVSIGIAACASCLHTIGWIVGSMEPPMCDDCVIAAAIQSCEGAK